MINLKIQIVLYVFNIINIDKSLLINPILAKYLGNSYMWNLPITEQKTINKYTLRFMWYIIIIKHAKNEIEQ